MLVETMTPPERLEEASRLWDRARLVVMHRKDEVYRAGLRAKVFPHFIHPLTHTNKTDGEYTILEIYMDEEMARMHLTSPHVIKQMCDWSTRPMLILERRINDDMLIFEVTPHAMKRFRERAKQASATRLDIAKIMSVDIYTYMSRSQNVLFRNMKKMPQSVIKQAQKHITPGWEVALQGSRYGLWLCESTCDGCYIRVKSFVDSSELFGAQDDIRKAGKSFYDYLRLACPLSVQSEVASMDYIKAKQKNIYRK